MDHGPLSSEKEERITSEQRTLFALAHFGLHVDTPLVPERAPPHEPVAPCPPRDLGRIEVVMGPMWSGKTSEIQRRARLDMLTPALNRSARRTMFVKHKIDTRYSTDAEESFVITHDQIRMPSVTTQRLMELVSNGGIEAADTFAIDEGHFFPDLLEFCMLAVEKGKHILVAALDLDHRRRPFKQVLFVAAQAEKVQKRKAVCHFCGGKAIFSLIYSPPVATSVSEPSGEEGHRFIVGGLETYRVACRGCYSLHADAKLLSET